MAIIALERAAPEDMGMNATRLARAAQYSQRVGEQLGGSGGATLIMRHDKIVGEWYWGRRDFSADSKPFDADTMVPYNSITKGFTATALSMLIEDGVVWLDDPAWRYIPELNKGDAAKITLRHLATHSSGFPAADTDWLRSFQVRRPDEHPYDVFVRQALTRIVRGLAYEPGTSHLYCDPGVCLLGEALYRACGERLPDLLRRRVLQPLGLRRLDWDFDDERANGISFSISDDWDGSIVGVSKEVRQVGSTWNGLIGNARDLAVFGLMLAHEGELGGVRIISPLAVRMMTTCQMPMPVRERYPHRGLYWWIKATPESPEMGHIVPYGTYSHSGGSHCVLTIMPSLDIVALMLRNRLTPGPPGFIHARDYPVFMDMVAASVDRLGA